MTNNKHFIIVLLLVLIIILSLVICHQRNRERFQYNDSRKLTPENCSQSMDDLINLVESLKAANFPVELRQAYAMSILTKDPKHAEKVRKIITDMDISLSEKKKLIELVDLEKGILLSLQDKHALHTANNIFKKMDAYENEMLYHTLSH